MFHSQSSWHLCLLSTAACFLGLLHTGLGTAQEAKAVLGVDKGRMEVLSLAFSPDGKLIAASDYNGLVRVWEAATGKVVHQFLRDETPGQGWAITFHPDGKVLAAGHSSGTVRLWNLESGKLVGKHACPGAVKELAFSQDGKMLAAGSDVRNESGGPPLYYGDVRVWDLKSGKETAKFQYREFVNFDDYPQLALVAFTPDGKRLLAGFSNGAKVWDLDTGKLSSTLEFLGKAMAHNPDVSLLAALGQAAADKNGQHRPTVGLWDVKKAKRSTDLIRLPSYLQKSSNPLFSDKIASSAVCLALSPDGKLLAVAGSRVPPKEEDAGKQVWLFDVQTGRKLAAFAGHDLTVLRVAFSPNGKTLATGNETIRLWDVPSLILAEKGDQKK